MKALCVSLVFCLWPLGVVANTNPVPVVVSAVMRSNSTLMDVVYRVNDPDDSTVKVRALAFIDGSRSFTRILRPSAFVEGTDTNLGDAIAANVNHTLTWDVAADWDIDLGQAKFEILCLDNRGLLQFDWISIPAASGQPALTISRDTSPTNQVLDALFWLYASRDPGVSLTGGVLRATSASGVFGGVGLANGSVPQGYAVPYLLRRMDLDPATSSEVDYAEGTARAGLLNAHSWHAANRSFGGMGCVVGWGPTNSSAWDCDAGGAIDVTAIAAGGSHSLALLSNGVVVGWGDPGWWQMGMPVGLTGVTAIAAGTMHSLALRGDGTVVAWGNNYAGQTNVPAGLGGVKAIAAGYAHNVALTTNGTVTMWGSAEWGQANMPPGLSNVTAIAAGGGASHTLALLSNGTVVGWGSSDWGQADVPPGLGGVKAVATGMFHSLALTTGGTVVAWGNNDYGQTNVPAGLHGVTAIAGGGQFSLALTSNGTVVAWGSNAHGQTNVPTGLGGVTAIAAGGAHGLALKPKAP